MDNSEITKKTDITEEELRKITEVYRNLNSSNRLLVASISGLLLTGQINTESEKRVG